MRRRKQNTILERNTITKRCYVLLHRLPQSQLPVLEDKMPDGEGKKEDEKRKTSNRFQSSSRRGRALTPNASKSHKQEGISTNEADTKTHVCRETKLSKQRNKERREASDHTQEPMPKMKRDSTKIPRWPFKKEETKSVSSAPMKSEFSKSFFRLGFEVYVREFKTYLDGFSERSKTNNGFCDIDNELEEELMTLNKNFDYEVNKTLVERIIKSSSNVEVSLEGQWATIKDAIIEAEREVLMEKLGKKKPEKRMAQECYYFPKQKIQKLSGKKNLQINSGEANRNLSKTSPKILLFEKNEVTIKMMDAAQSTSERETAPSNDIMTSKNESTTRNSELKADETPLQDYDGASNMLPNEDPKSNGFVNNTEKLNKIQKTTNGSDNVVLKVSDQQESLGTNQTIEKLLEYENSQERSNESGDDTDLKNCEQQEGLVAKQENDAVSSLENISIGNTVVEVSSNSSDKLNTENNTRASKFGISKSDGTKPDRVIFEESVVKITLDETSVTGNEASCRSATLSPFADMLFNQDTVERRDSSLQNVMPAEENTLFVNKSDNDEVLQIINKTIDDVASKVKTQICLDPPSVFPCSTSGILFTRDNAKGNEDSSPVKTFSPVSKNNFPSIDSPTNDEEAIQQLITEKVLNGSLEARKQMNFDGYTVFSCSVTDLKSDPGNAEKRLFPPAKASTSLLVNSFTDGDESLNKTPENAFCVAETTSCYEAQKSSHLNSDKESVHNTEKQGSLPADVSPHVNSPSVSSPINDEEAVELITATVENLPFGTKKQTSCDVHNAFSSSTSVSKSNPDNAGERPSTSATSDNMLEDSLKTASVESAANNSTSLNVLGEDDIKCDETRKFAENSKSRISKEEEDLLNSSYCKNSIKYDILKCFFILRSESPAYRKELRQNSEKEKAMGLNCTSEWMERFGRKT